MVTVSNNRKVLSVEENFKMTLQIENEKKKTYAYRKFGLVNSTMQMIWKNITKLLEQIENKTISKA
jgi:polysaccharide pyruvyl transferase WcaK-like protein